MDMMDREQQREYLLGLNDAYKSDTKQFVIWCDSQELPYSADSLVEWIGYLVYSGYLNNTVRRRFYAVRDRLKKMIELQGYPEEERLLKRYALDLKCQEIQLPKRSALAVKKTKYFTQEEIKQLVKESKPRTSLWIEFLYVTGLRIAEACNIHLRHVRQETRKIYAVRVLGKGRKERIVYINSGLRRRIRETFDGKTYLFENTAGSKYTEKRVWELLRKEGEKILGRHLTPHCLRHSFATHRIKQTGMITGVSMYLGHADISTTLGEYNSELLDPEFLANGLWGDRGRRGGRKGA